MYFLRKAQDIYQIKTPKELSPSFWDSEGKSPNVSEGLEEIFSGIEHPLGMLLTYDFSIDHLSLTGNHQQVDYYILQEIWLGLLSCF